jgi:tRNA A-37 threonylcarbamoyl transferase component Bud32
MREIKDLIKNVEKYNIALLQNTFESKKNSVGYVVLNNQPRILKWFVPGLKNNMDVEYEVLKKGYAELSMPSPLEKDTENNVLVLSYLMGENVCDILNDEKTSLEEKKRITSQVADWLVKFHGFFNTEEGFRIRGDACLRNFILSKGRIWGVDFEESRIGKPVEDVATLCASLLSTNPMFTDEKFQLCQTFLESYRKSAHWSLEKINSEIGYALLERIQWRPQDEETLRKYAMKIRNKGLQGARHNF